MQPCTRTCHIYLTVVSAPLGKSSLRLDLSKDFLKPAVELLVIGMFQNLIVSGQKTKTSRFELTSPMRLGRHFYFPHFQLQNNSFFIPFQTSIVNVSKF